MKGKNEESLPYKFNWAVQYWIDYKSVALNRPETVGQDMAEHPNPLMQL